MRKKFIPSLLALSLILALWPVTAMAGDVVSGMCGAEGNNAFYKCSNLIKISIPESVAEIVKSAFTYCGSLTVDNRNLKYQSDGVLFSKDGTDLIRCPSVIEGVYHIPDGVIRIADGAFDECVNLTAVTIPDSVTSIGADAFSHCYGLTSVTMPNSVAGIGDYAFFCCTSLTAISIPDGAVRIGEEAFYGCEALTTITIPDSVTSIGHWAFDNSGLREIHVDSGNPNYQSMDGVLFSKDGTMLLRFPSGRGGSYQIPAKVSRIEDYAFRGSSNLTDICIPDSVTSIGSGAFAECRGLETLILPDSVIRMGAETFERCDGLREVTISAGLTNIADSAFRGCAGLTTITIPDGLTSIDAYAFADCTALTAVTIPGSVTSIGDSAFVDCIELTDITIPDSVTSIGAGAFAECFSLTTVSIPDSVTSIEDYTFNRCLSLTSITLPDSVTSIGSYVFAYGVLETITIPKSVTSIGCDVFGYHNYLNLTDIYYGGSPKQWRMIFDTDPLYNKNGEAVTIHFALTDAEAGFGDAAYSAWYAGSIAYIVEKGLFNGAGNVSFAPNAGIAQAIAWTVLARYVGAGIK